MAENSNAPELLQTAPYTIAQEQYRCAYDAYQRHFTLVRRIISVVVLVLLLADFAWQSVRHPDNKLTYVLMMLCAALLFLQWYNPRKTRRSVLDVTRQLIGDQHVFRLYADGVSFQLLPETGVPDEAAPADEDAEMLPEPSEASVQAPTFLPFADGALQVLELEELFVVCVRKQTFYVLPKAALSGDAQIAQLKTAFQEALGKDYHVRCANQ